MSIYKPEPDKCPDCNLPFEYSGVKRTATQTIGIYKCPKCGKTVNG